MPITDTATLVISCKSDAANVENFTNAVERADKKSNQLLKTVAGFASVRVFKRLGDQAVAAYADMSEEMARFNITYAKVLPDAEKKFMALRKEFDLDKKSAYSALVATGDLLTGFGMSADNALDYSDKIARLGADLAAYKNYAGGAEGVTNALAMAVIGNTQRARSLGIVIRQDSEEYKKFYEEGKRVYGGNENMARAFAVLQIATLQSKNALGSWKSENGKYVNSLQKNIYATKEFKQALGQNLVPAYQKAIDLQTSLMNIFSKASPETQRFLVLTGGLTTAMLALKTAIGIKTVADSVSSKLGLQSAAKMKSATSEMVTLEKTLQKEKLATLALDQARAKVNEGQTNLEAAKRARQKIFDSGSGDLDALAAADLKVNAAQEQLELYQKAMRKAEENAQKASNAVSVLNANTNKNIDYAHERLRLVEAQTAADNASEAVALKLKAADERRAAALKRLSEARRGVRETGVDWHNSVMKNSPDQESNYQEYKYQRTQLTAATADFSKATADVKKYEAALEETGEAARKANDALKAFDKAREDEKKYLAGLKENIAAQNAREAALKQGKSALEAQKQATAAYNRVIDAEARKASIATAAEDQRNLALRMGATEAQANAVKTEYLAAAQAKASQRAGIFTRSLGAMKNGFRSATVAAVGLMKAVLPMLAVSAAIAGIDYLINRSRRAAEAAAQISGKEAQAARITLEKNDQIRNSDRERLRQYEILASYTNRTAQEQEKLVEHSEYLRNKYDGLNLPLLKQNETLKETSQLWDEINRKQKENRLAELKEGLEKASRDLNLSNWKLKESQPGLFSFDTLGKTFKNVWETMKNPKGVEKLLVFNPNLLFFNGLKKARQSQNALAASFNIMDKESLAAYERRLQSIQTKAKKENNIGLFEQIEEQLVKIKQIKEIQQQINDAEKSENGGLPGEDAEKGMKATREMIEKVTEAEKKMKDILWKDDFNSGDSERKTELLNAKIKEAGKAYQDALKRYNNPTNEQAKKQAQLDAAAASEKRLEYEREIHEIALRTEQERAQKLQQTAEAEKSFLMRLTEAQDKFRETSQTAVMSNTEQSVRLQSRMFIQGGSGLQQAAKMAADAAKKSAEATEKIKKLQEDMKKTLQDIHLALKNVGFSTAG